MLCTKPPAVAGGDGVVAHQQAHHGLLSTHLQRARVGERAGAEVACDGELDGGRRRSRAEPAATQRDHGEREREQRLGGRGAHLTEIVSGNDATRPGRVALS